MIQTLDTKSKLLPIPDSQLMRLHKPLDSYSNTDFTFIQPHQTIPLGWCLPKQRVAVLIFCFTIYSCKTYQGGNMCHIKRWINKSLSVDQQWKDIRFSRVCINTDSTFNAAHMSLRWPMIHNAFTTKLYSLEFLGCGIEGGLAREITDE